MGKDLGERWVLTTGCLKRWAMMSRMKREKIKPKGFVQPKENGTFQRVKVLMRLLDYEMERAEKMPAGEGMLVREDHRVNK